MAPGGTRLHDHHTPDRSGCVSRSGRGRLSQRRQLAPGAGGDVEAVHVRRGTGEPDACGSAAAGRVLECGRTPKQDQPLGRVAHARSEGVATARKRCIGCVKSRQPADASIHAGVSHGLGFRPQLVIRTAAESGAVVQNTIDSSRTAGNGLGEGGTLTGLGGQFSCHVGKGQWRDRAFRNASAPSCCSLDSRQSSSRLSFKRSSELGVVAGRAQHELRPSAP